MSLPPGFEGDHAVAVHPCCGNEGRMILAKPKMENPNVNEKGSSRVDADGCRRGCASREHSPFRIDSRRRALLIAQVCTLRTFLPTVSSTGSTQSSLTTNEQL